MALAHQKLEQQTELFTSASMSTSILQQTLSFAIEHPIQALLIISSLVCIATRIVTGLQYRSSTSNAKAGSTSTAQTVATLPYWIPWLGHAISFALGGTDFLSRSARQLGPNSAVYALMMGNTKHNIVTVPSLAHQIVNDRHAPVSMEPFIFRAMEYVWADRGSNRNIDPTHLWGPIHSVLSGMLRESFVAAAIQRTVASVEDRTWNLVSGARSVVDQSIWERQARVELISSSNDNNDNNNSDQKNNNDSDNNRNNPLTVEASLHPLIRYFVGDIASTVLYGRNFMENNPTIMPDLWEMDSQFNLFIAGVPTWFPGMQGPSRARERVIAAVQEHHDALYKYLDGQDPGYKWDDMSDVSSVIVDRARAFRNAGATPRAYATADGAILWAMNVNANQVIFWLLWYVYSTPGLLEEMRSEIAPYVRIRHPESSLSGLNTTTSTSSIKEAPKLDIDIDSIWTKCPLLKGAFLETMRLESHSMSYKEVMGDFVVTESVDDARLLGKREPQAYVLRKGELVCIPHGVHQSDEKYFSHPDKFDARRFWVKENNHNDKNPAGLDGDDNDDKNKHDDEKNNTTNNNNNNDNKHIRVDYGTMRVWGGGKHLCKGKTFAEREVVLFAAAILMHWDMEPVGNGGKWLHPGRQPGSGTVSPKNDVRVRVSRREAW
ncbi:hypothetical protein A1O1_01888 [Capronia coronata CBS 617.96]|uniref:Cytochrome P450 n=1 Tax=Capronia coronata CBS 617.96 TaxID=1182541 RepID=W9YW51_9EURO|nr:uncharacterized protein A1O1_01888 [Capronia coronata CBS 617.96]EXJ93496.1 hypothetical protein A1O1_01888 [Capronia coronata CBS 617.96]